jgi:hypothetical protein
MAPQEIPQNLENDFAKKCRTALEKSWGIEIPKPHTKTKICGATIFLRKKPKL